MLTWRKKFLSISLPILLILLTSLTGCDSAQPVSTTVQNQQSKQPAEAQKTTPQKTTEQTPKPVSETVTSKPVSESLTTTVTPGQKLKVSYIDVGQADSILVQIPNGKNLLIDAGTNAAANTVVSYIKKQGINRLDIVIGTHPHEDHIGGLDAVINTFDIGQVVMPRVDSTTQTYKDVIAAIQKKGLKITQAKAGLNLDLGPEVIAQLLAPNSSNYEDLNDYSAVLKLTYGTNTFLFEGDAQTLSENEMINSGANLKADVLKVGHHGSKTSTSTAFLAKVSPKYAIISVGKGNDYGHPAQQTLDRLTAAGAKVYRTDQSGTVVAESDGTNITFNTIVTEVQPRAPTQTSSTPAVTAPQSVPAPVIAPVPAPSTSKNITVYITKTGKKYHLNGCRYLSKSKIPISLSDAKVEGYTPCSVCNPPQ